MPSARRLTAAQRELLGPEIGTSDPGPDTSPRLPGEPTGKARAALERIAALDGALYALWGIEGRRDLARTLGRFFGANMAFSEGGPPSIFMKFSDGTIANLPRADDPDLLLRAQRPGPAALDLIDRLDGLPVEQIATAVANELLRLVERQLEVLPAWTTSVGHGRERWTAETAAELATWADTWPKAAELVLERQAEPRTAHSATLDELSVEDLLMLAAADTAPRGWAAGDADLYKRLNTMRRRVRRRVAASE